jgi:hypothetical protein
MPANTQRAHVDAQWWAQQPDWYRQAYWNLQTPLLTVQEHDRA